MTKFTQKWAVASFIEDLPIGFEFEASNNPLHTTIAGVLAIDLSSSKIIKLLESVIKNHKAFYLTGKSKVNWGEGLNVTLLKASINLDRLIIAVQRTLLDNGAVFNEPKYLLDGFTPHVTVQKHDQLDRGQRVKIKSVSLVDMFPNNDYKKRKILSRTLLS